MKMQHVTISVSNLEASIEFYKSVLELEIQHDMRPMGRPIVFLAETGADTRVELIEDREKPYEGQGISIGFSVSDVEAKWQELKSKGLEVTDIISPSPKTKFFFFSDPDGVRIQFIQ